MHESGGVCDEPWMILDISLSDTYKHTDTQIGHTAVNHTDRLDPRTCSPSHSLYVSLLSARLPSHSRINSLPLVTHKLYTVRVWFRSVHYNFLCKLFPCSFALWSIVYASFCSLTLAQFWTLCDDVYGWLCERAGLSLTIPTAPWCKLLLSLARRPALPLHPSIIISLRFLSVTFTCDSSQTDASQ